MKKFFEELKTLQTVEKRMEEIKARKLPVIIFGAGVGAKQMTDQLNNYGVEILGYAVDEKYFRPNQTYLERPILNFEESIAKYPDHIFIFSLGTKNGQYDSTQKKRIYEFINDKRILKYFPVHKMESISRDYIFANLDRFEETYNILEDELSKKTMCAYLKTHVTGKAENVKDVLVDNEYFNDLTRDALDGGGGYVDCGAFTGDTVEEFIKFVNGNYSKIFAIEPDKENFDKLKKFVADNSYKNIALFNCGVWDKKDTLYFRSQGDMCSAISEEGNITVEVEAIDNMVGDFPVNLIKMDVEGAELNALKGAVKTMEHSKPLLALSAYHRKEDLITIPQFIKEIYKDCRFYLRKHEGYDLYGLDLYALPK